YPRGEAVEQKGGKKSLYAVDYAARIANELGVDAVKLNVPEDDPKRRSQQPAPYDGLELSYEERIKKVIKSAGKTLVLFSGGSMLGDDDLIYRAKTCLEQGAAGLLFGRNLWQREWKEALRITEKLKKLMLEL
ncbi:MAG: fructose-bisphosphate aldolase, partial [Candidatus Thorarchaeota archaeon]